VVVLMTDIETTLPWPGFGRNRRRHTPDPPAALIALVAQGDQAAFAMFYGAIAPRVFGMCRRVLSNGAQAEEVTQDVMVEMWRIASRYDPVKGSVSSWALSMAHRRAIDRYRARHSTGQRERLFAARDAIPAYDHVAETTITNLEAQQVRTCLAAMTDLQREAVTLAYYDGYTYIEVAEVLDAELPAVKARIRDGLLRLRDCLRTMEIV
jgi:RNA polymerase sigma-70 factor, ECF subfamily